MITKLVPRIKFQITANDNTRVQYNLQHQLTMYLIHDLRHGQWHRIYKCIRDHYHLPLESIRIDDKFYTDRKSSDYVWIDMMNCEMICDLHIVLTD